MDGPSSFYALGVYGLSGPGTFSLTEITGVTADVSELSPSDVTRTLATSGTVTISSYSDTRIAGSFSVQFPGVTGMTSATFDFDPCN